MQNHRHPAIGLGLLLGLTLAAPGLARDGSATGPHPVERATLETPDLEWEDAALQREELVRRVLERNPDLAAARAAWRAASERAPQARSLGDPMVVVETAPISWFGDGRIGYGAAVSQPIPYPGTLALRGARAEAEARARELDIETVRLDLAVEAAQLFDRYRFVHRALEINAEHVELLESFREIATSRYAAGLVPQPAPIQAEVASTHVRHRGVVLEAERQMLRARINALLHRRADAAVPAPDPAIELPPALNGLLEASESAVPRRPEIRSQEAEIEAGEVRVALERLAAKPDFEAMTSFSSMWPMSDHRWMAGVGIRIPFWKDRIRAAVAEAEAEVQAGESRLAALHDRVRAEIELAALELRRALDVAHLYANRVIPATEDQIQAARSGFETGQVPMLDLIDAERDLRNARLEYEEALTEAWAARAAIDRALGRMPSSSEAGTNQPVREPNETTNSDGLEISS